MKKSIITFALLSLLLGGISCVRKTANDSIVLPNTSVLSVQSSWGVVTSNYLRLREKAALDSEALTGLTKGSVVEIISATDKKETIDKLTSYWYRIDIDGIRGWVFGAYIDIFTSKPDAEKRADEIK
jgi:hypothetical protein